MGGPAALSGFELAAASSAPVAAGDGPARHTKSPVASINAERPLALIVIGNLPICPPPKRNEPPRVSATGQKKGIFARVRAKAGQRHCTRWAFETVRSRNLFGINAPGVSRAERCYEPAGGGSCCRDS